MIDRISILLFALASFLTLSGNLQSTSSVSLEVTKTEIVRANQRDSKTHLHWLSGLTKFVSLNKCADFSFLVDRLQNQVKFNTHKDRLLAIRPVKHKINFCRSHRQDLEINIDS